jgi:hypothetical protein
MRVNLYFFKLFDAKGKLLIKQKLFTGNKTVFINIGDIASGIYMTQIATAKHSLFNQKINVIK